MQDGRAAFPSASAPRRQLRRLAATVAGAVLLVGLVSACAPRAATHGHMVEDRRLAEIQVGSTSRSDVAALLGSPSAVGTFDEDVWYYVGERTEYRAFQLPEAVERRVIAIRFNSLGLVEEVEQLELADGERVQPVDRSTPTLGRRMTVLEQLLGNVGRFEGMR